MDSRAGAWRWLRRSEFGFVITKDGKRVAGSRWYFGLPNPEFPGLNVYWRADLAQRPAWTGWVAESRMTLGDDNKGSLTNWVRSAAYAMRGIRAIQARFAMPRSGYGIYVCVDSVVLALAKATALGGPPPQGQRPTTTFPVMRARQATSLGSGETVALDALFSRAAEMQLNGGDPSYIPDDALLRTAPQDFATRLKAAFPSAARDRFFAFPEVGPQIDAFGN